MLPEPIGVAPWQLGGSDSQRPDTTVTVAQCHTNLAPRRCQANLQKENLQSEFLYNSCLICCLQIRQVFASGGHSRRFREQDGLIEIYLASYGVTGDGDELPTVLIGYEDGQPQGSVLTYENPYETYAIPLTAFKRREGIGRSSRK